MEQGVKDVQENQTTVEKYEKIFKKSSERKKVRQSQEETRKVSAMLLYTCRTCVGRVTTWRTCVGRVTTWRTCVRRVKNVQQTTVEKFENIFKNSSERKKVRQSEEATGKVFRY